MFCMIWLELNQVHIAFWTFTWFSAYNAVHLHGASVQFCNFHLHLFFARKIHGFVTYRAFGRNVTNILRMHFATVSKIWFGGGISVSFCFLRESGNRNEHHDDACNNRSHCNWFYVFRIFCRAKHVCLLTVEHKIKFWRHSWRYIQEQIEIMAAHECW